MPAELFVLRGARPVGRVGLGCSLAAAVVFLAACNGQTAFVEQSRSLRREVGIAQSDDDVRGRLKAKVNEGPLSKQTSDGSASSDSYSHEDSQSDQQNPADGIPGSIGEITVPQSPSPVVTLPKDDADSNPDNSPVATKPSAPSSPVATTPSAPSSPVATTPSAPSSPVAKTPSAPTPHAGDWVNVQLTQPRAKVDILWVVDSSGSMAWAQNQLKSKFQSFAKKLKDTRIDFQVGVTSLDVCQVDGSSGFPVADALCPDDSFIPNGAKIGNKIVGPLRGTLQADPTSKRTILRDTVDFVESFQRTAMLGTEGSAFEHGLWAAKMAVEKSLTAGGENQGFIRPDASLSVVVLSDEEDDSVQMWCEDAYGRTSLTTDGKKDLSLCREGGRSPFLDAFGVAPYALMKTPKGNPLTTHKFTADQFKSWAANAGVKGSGNFRVSAITGLRKQNGEIDCGLKSGGPEESGTNYIKAAQMTGGAVENICSSDWSSVLTNIGQNTVELATRVSLPAGRVPFPQTLVVKVDGQELNAMQYVYDSSLHAVVFKTPPAMGAEVIVSYRETLVD